MVNVLGRQRAVIQQWMTALLEPNQIVEIRMIGPIASRSFATGIGNQFDDMIDFVMNANKKHKGIYFTPNPMKHVRGTGASGNHRDEDVAKRNWLLIDVDPIRIKETNASQSEVDASKRVAESIFSTMAQLKFGGMIFGASGNGFHVCVPVDLPNNELSKEKHKKLLKALDERFSRESAKVDKATFNASRIWKFPGTMAMKGPHSDDRPHRYAKLIDIPTEPRKHAQANTALLDQVLAHWCPKYGKEDDERGELIRRCRLYLEKEPPAVEGEDGSGRCYHVAGVCYGGFALNEEECLIAMQDWNLRCRPPWSEKELRHKIESVKAKNGPRGKFLQSQRVESNGQLDTGTSLIVQANTIKPKVVEWLWPNRIPLGKLTTFAGVGGLGKTFCLLDIAARISRGSEWPHSGGEIATPGQTLFVSGEDDPDDTLVPRLEGMQADLSKIWFLRSEVADVFTLNDLVTLENAIQQAGAEVRFIAIDPPTCFLGGVDDHRNSELRGLLSPLKSFAAKHNVAIVFNTHLNKGGGQVDAMMRVMGSVAWVNAVRAAHLFARDPDDDSKRIFACMKNNLGPETKALAYCIKVADQKPMIEWLGEVDTTADDAVMHKSKSQKDSAKDWLIDRFKEKLEWNSKDLFETARHAGIADKTLYRARDELKESGDLPPCRKAIMPNGDTVWTWWVPADWPLLNPPTDEGEF